MSVLHHLAALFIITFALFSCEYGKPYKEETTVIVNQVAYDCISEKLNGLWHGTTLCYDSNGVLKFKQHLNHGELDGEVIFFHECGAIYKIEQFSNGKSLGVQHYFYPSGEVYAYVYRDSIKNQIFYQRIYDIEGEVFETIFPIRVKYLEVDDPERLKDSVVIGIELLHSEFENSFICAMIEQDPTDWCFLGGTKNPLQILYITFPDPDGKIFISGVLFEYIEPDVYMGEYPFEFEYYIEGRD